jgi:hypothetical protein
MRRNAKPVAKTRSWGKYLFTSRAKRSSHQRCYEFDPTSLERPHLRRVFRSHLHRLGPNSTAGRAGGFHSRNHRRNIGGRSHRGSRAGHPHNLTPGPSQPGVAAAPPIRGHGHLRRRLPAVGKLADHARRSHQLGDTRAGNLGRFVGGGRNVVRKTGAPAAGPLPGPINYTIDPQHDEATIVIHDFDRPGDKPIVRIEPGTGFAAETLLTQNAILWPNSPSQGRAN